MNIKDNLSRFILIFILLLSTFLTIFYKKHLVTLSAEQITLLEQKKLNFIFKIIFFQILLYEEIPSTNKEEMTNQILQELTYITQGIPQTYEIQIQAYIVYRFLNQNPKFPNLPNQEPYNQYKKILNDIFIQKKEGLHPDEILQLPLGKLALYYYYKQTDSEKAKNYYLELIKIHLPFQIGFMILSILFFISIFIGIIFIFRFFSKLSVHFYGSFLQSMESSKMIALLEAASIYLFLYIPLQFFLVSIFKDKLPESYLLYIQFIYSVIVFLISFLYLRNEIGFPFLKNSLWTDYYDSSTLSEIVKNFNLKNQEKQKEIEENKSPQEKSSSEENFFQKLDEAIKSVNLKPESPLKEIFYGFMGFVIIFPLSLMVLLFTMLLTNTSNYETESHPIVFYIDKNFWLVFFMAVIFAPITEEIVFRNWIYGFLRYHFSVFSAAFISGLMFAYLHPQGMVAFPYLTFLGMSLAFLREFRPGIFAPVITHAFVNLFSLTMLMMIQKFMNI